MKPFALASAALSATFLIAASAQAFTYDNRTNQSSDGSARFRDPADPANAKTDDHSGFSFKVSGGAAPGAGAGGVESRFLPSANSQFNSPYYGPSFMNTMQGIPH